MVILWYKYTISPVNIVNLLILHSLFENNWNVPLITFFQASDFNEHKWGTCRSVIFYVAVSMQYHVVPKPRRYNNFSSIGYALATRGPWSIVLVTSIPFYGIVGNKNYFKYTISINYWKHVLIVEMCYGEHWYTSFQKS